MEMPKVSAMLLLLLLLLLLLNNVFCQDLDEENWRGGREEENKFPNSEKVHNVFVRRFRKPGARQNLGKKISGKTQPTGKRRKFQTFVGLMGKRSFNEEGFLRAALKTENY